MKRARTRSSAFNREIGELLYTGGYVSTNIDRSLVLSIKFADNVTEIVGGCFESRTTQQGSFQNTSIKKIIVPAHITHIGGYAFEGCESLVSVHVSNPHTEIDDRAFYACSSLSLINLTGTKVRYACLFQSYKLQTVHLPEAITHIEEGAFGENVSLQSINIPEFCRSIGDRTFMMCTKLVNLRLPNTCTLGLNVFIGCNALEELANSKNFPNIESYLRYRYRLPAFVYPALMATKICDARMAAGGDIDDGIGANEEKDVLVGMYRKLKVVDLWRRVLEYVKLTDDNEGGPSKTDLEDDSEDNDMSVGGGGVVGIYWNI